jgi:hypothetical protein
MRAQQSARTAVKWLATGVGVATAAYAAYVGMTWYRYGRAPSPRPEEQDPLLDRFMPRYDVVDRHHVHVAAPAALTLSVARGMDLQQSMVVRAIIASRGLLLGATAEDRPRPQAFMTEMQSLGWGVLADVRGREVVAGAVTKPWQADVTFRSLPPDEFAAFSEPDYVKIAWTLRADEVNATESILRTETRAIATDLGARRKFRWYWAFLSPGITLIRWAAFEPVKREAERRAGQA